MRDFNCMLDILCNLAELSQPVRYQEFFYYYHARSAHDSNLFYYNKNLLREIKAINITKELAEDNLIDRPHFDPDNYSSIEYADDAKTIAIKGYYEVSFYSLSWLGYNLKDFLLAIKKQVSNDLNKINFYDSTLIAVYGNTQVHKTLF